MRHLSVCQQRSGTISLGCAGSVADYVSGLSGIAIKQNSGDIDSPDMPKRIVSAARKNHRSAIRIRSCIGIGRQHTPIRPPAGPFPVVISLMPKRVIRTAHINIKFAFP